MKRGLKACQGRFRATCQQLAIGNVTGNLPTSCWQVAGGGCEVQWAWSQRYVPSNGRCHGAAGATEWGSDGLQGQSAELRERTEQSGQGGSDAA